VKTTATRTKRCRQRRDEHCRTRSRVRTPKALQCIVTTAVTRKLTPRVDEDEDVVDANTQYDEHAHAHQHTNLGLSKDYAHTSPTRTRTAHFARTNTYEKHGSRQ
jgi:hypothetical protein